MEPEYAVKISLTEHRHDNPQKPYYWCLTKCEEVWHQIAFGWEESPQECFQAAMTCYFKGISDTENAQKAPRLS